MKKTLLTLFILFFALPTVIATDICLDFDGPEAPGNIDYYDNIILTWETPNDEPDCSGIDYYKVYRDGELVGTTQNNFFADGPFENGTYFYEVFAVDLGGNQGPGSELSATPGSSPIEELNPPNNGGGGGGGRSSNSNCGDQTCDSNENCLTCPDDCGACEIPIPAVTLNNEDDSNQFSENGENGVEIDSQGNLLDAITGAVTAGTGAGSGSIIAWLFVLVVLGIVIYFIATKGKKTPIPQTI